MSCRKFLRSTLRVAGPIALSMLLVRQAEAVSSDVPTLKVTAPNGVHTIPLVLSDNGLTSGSSTYDGDTITWTLDLADASYKAYASGQISLINNSSSARAYAVELIMPVDAPLTNTFIGGSGKITLTANANGGSIKCAPSMATLVSHRHDGAIATGVHYCPFSMATSGAGTASTVQVYGAPFPSLASIDAEQQVSIAFNPLLTDGDTAQLTLSAKVDGDESIVGPPPTPVGGPDNDGKNEVVDPPGGGEAEATPTPTPVAPTPPAEEPDVEVPPVVPTAVDSESGSLSVERIRARSPNLKFRVERDGVAAEKYSTEIRATGLRGGQAFDCIIGEIAPGAKSVTLTLRPHESFRGSLEIGARVVSEALDLAASGTAKVKRARIERRMMMRRPACPIRLLRAK